MLLFNYRVKKKNCDLAKERHSYFKRRFCNLTRALDFWLLVFFKFIHYILLKTNWKQLKRECCSRPILKSD